MNNLKRIVKRLRHLNIDKQAMINNSVIFVIAWFTAYWFFQVFTMIPAFSLGANMLIFNSEIDFNSVNTAASQRDLWSSADHINTLFLTPVIFSVVLALIAVLFFMKWDTDRLNVRRYLFWLILCMVVRVGGNFIFGHIFDLWNWNIVTDFMGLTYPSVFLKYLFVLIVASVVAIIFNLMSHEIKKLFNPYLDNRIDNLVSNVFYPTVIGSVFILICSLPRVPINELSCVAFMFLLVVFFLCRPFVYKYEGMTNHMAKEEYEPVNKTSLIILALLVVADVFLMRGFFIESSPYRYFFVESMFLAVVIFIIVVAAFYYIRVYNKRRNAYRKAAEKRQREIDMLNQMTRTSGDENWTQGNKINLDKYESAFNNDFETTEEKEDKNESDEDVVKVDYEHSEQYGFKRYDLKKYNERWWK